MPVEVQGEAEEVMAYGEEVEILACAHWAS